MPARSALQDAPSDQEPGPGQQRAAAQRDRKEWRAAAGAVTRRATGTGVHASARLPGIVAAVVIVAAGVVTLGVVVPAVVVPAVVTAGVITLAVVTAGVIIPAVVTLRVVVPTTVAVVATVVVPIVATVVPARTVIIIAAVIVGVRDRHRPGAGRAVSGKHHASARQPDRQGQRDQKPS